MSSARDEVLISGVFRAPAEPIMEPDLYFSATSAAATRHRDASLRGRAPKSVHVSVSPAPYYGVPVPPPRNDPTAPPPPPPPTATHYFYLLFFRLFPGALFKYRITMIYIRRRRPERTERRAAVHESGAASSSCPPAGTRARARAADCRQKNETEREREFFEVFYY